MKKIIAIIFGIVVILGIAFFLFNNDSSYDDIDDINSNNFNNENSESRINEDSDHLENIDDEKENVNDINQEINKNEIGNFPPEDLALAFDINDLTSGNIFISPFGIVRHNRDKGHGHGGIDIPLAVGDPIYAVADSKIIHYEYNSDDRGGNDVHLLIKEGEREGEGWAFLIEHLILDEGLNLGDDVKKGQKIGESAITQGSNHMQLTYLFNNYEFSRDHTCWTNQLSESEKLKFESAFEDIKEELIEGWSTAFEDDYYPYKSLIDGKDPLPCYEYGTDGRTK